MWGAVTDQLRARLDDVELIGRGGSGAVYRAIQRDVGRTVAVKVLRVPVDGRTASAEVRTQGRLSWHANVLTLYGCEVAEDGTAALVLEYAAGGSLTEKVRRSGPCSGDEILQLARELSAALTAAHEIGVVHCDIKPSNVLFAADGSSRLADFGIARQVGDTTATLDRFEGSIAFAPPELFDGSRPAPANDVYGLGLCLWFAATGRQPFGADTSPGAAVIARVRTESLSLSDAVTDLDPATAALLDRCLSKDPARRPTAAELHQALLPLDRPIRDQPRHRRRPRAKAVGAVALLVALMATVLVVGSWSRPGAADRTDLCGSFATFVRDRNDLLNQVSADVEQSRSPTSVIERLLVQYPEEWARTVAPYVVDALGDRAGLVDVTQAQLAQLTQADVLASVSGGKSVVFDGGPSNFDTSVLPGDLRAPAEAFSEANRIGVERCPSVASDITASKARMYSAIRANLVDPAFMASFFSDPRSPGLFDTSLVLLMAQMARPYFEVLLTGHWDWFVELLEGSAATRSAITHDYPDVMLRALAEAPSIGPTLARDEWRADLQVGIDGASPVARSGMQQLFGPQLAALGLDAS